MGFRFDNHSAILFHSKCMLHNSSLFQFTHVWIWKGIADTASKIVEIVCFRGLLWYGTGYLVQNKLLGNIFYQSIILNNFSTPQYEITVALIQNHGYCDNLCSIYRYNTRVTVILFRNYASVILARTIRFSFFLRSAPVIRSSILSKQASEGHYFEMNKLRNEVIWIEVKHK